MKLQVLVSTMYQTDHSLLKKMNIQSDAIVVNQCERNEFEEFDYKGNLVRFISLAERGVGLSRNNALMRATADICVFADEDVAYVDDYKEIILNAFANSPDADLILFNVFSSNQKRPTYEIKKYGRVRLYSCLRYGTVKIAVRTEMQKKANIYFSLLFGGGAMYSSGEDSLFIAECIKKGLKIFTEPTVIGFASQEGSSWFEGYTDKYFIDKGVLFACLSKRWAEVLCLQFCIRHQKMFIGTKTWSEAYKIMLKGISMYNTAF
jgi:glycosyltransferase involved in cell wall biosynthesis